MKYCGRMLICVLAGVALNAGAIVSISDLRGGRYENIASRNVFGLRPRERSHTQAQTPVVVRPKIRLAGITTLLGRKMAFLMLSETKPGGVSECLLLHEGEAQEEIQMKEIHQKIVKLVNHGEEQTLDFDEVLPPGFIMEDPSPTLPPVISQQPPLTPGEQILVIEAQRLKAMQDGDPIATILPPTEFTAEITNGTP